jgi:hypothetical protein
MHPLLERLFAKDKKMLNIAFYGDSIFASGYKDIPGLSDLEKSQLPPRGCEYLSVQKYLYDAFDFNKPLFFNVRHPIFRITGDIIFEGSKVMPNKEIPSSFVHPVAYYTDYTILEKEGQSIQFDMKGHEELVLVFESGEETTEEVTGKVQVIVYDEESGASNQTFDTSFKSPVPIGKYNRYAPLLFVSLSGFQKDKTYSVHMCALEGEKPVRFWGIFLFTGKVLFVHNESKPGFSWNGLYGTVYSDLILNETDLVILEAPMYHDRSLEQAEKDAKKLIGFLQDHGCDVILCSCTPGGVIPLGRTFPVPGAESFPVYMPGENVYTTFNRIRYFHTDELVKDTLPDKGDVYEGVIHNQTYEFVCWKHPYKDNESVTSFLLPYELKDENIPFPLILKRKQGKGKESICYHSMNRRFTMEEHRDRMKKVASDTGCVFIDLLEAFEEEAKKAGESLNTKGYSIQKDHPLYDFLSHIERNGDRYPWHEGPILVNHMTLFFNPEDGHHLEHPAHKILFQKLAEILEIENLNRKERE